MSIIDAIIQGIVQGLTEFLPVSSSGHLSITQHILGATENNLFFNVMLHVLLFTISLYGVLSRNFSHLLKMYLQVNLNGKR